MSNVPHLTPERQTTILEAIRRGSTKRVAFALARYTTQAEDYWRKRAADGAEPYATFIGEMDVALADAEDALVRIVRTAALDDPKHAQWLLERRFRWWTPRDGTPVAVQSAPAELPAATTDEELEGQIRGGK